MRKLIYVLIISALSLLVMGYGMKLESESLLVNGVAVLEFVVPALTFLLTHIFILMFEKEKYPLIILATSLAVGVLANLIAIGYYSISMNELNGGVFNLAMILILVSALSFISLTLYRKSQQRRFQKPKPKH